MFINVLNSCSRFCYFTSCWCRSVFHFFVVVNCTICCCDSFWTVVFICVVDCTNRLVIFIHNSCCNHFTSCVVVFYNDVRLNFFVDVRYFDSLTSFNITRFVTDCCSRNKFVDFAISCCDGFWFVISRIVIVAWLLVSLIVNWILDDCAVRKCIVNNNVTSFFVNISNFCCTFYNLTCFVWASLNFFVVVYITSRIFNDFLWLVICCVVSCTCWSCLRIHYLRSDYFTCSVYVVNNNITFDFFVDISNFCYAWNNVTFFRSLSQLRNQLECATIFSCDCFWFHICCIVLCTCWSFWCIYYLCL